MSPVDFPTDAVLTYLTAAPTSGFAGQSVQIVDAWAGADNLLWRVRTDPAQSSDAVLKLFLDAGQARSRRQHVGHTLFAPLGLAPRPLWMDRYPQGLARQVLVYAWADGDPPHPDNPSHMVEMARAVAQIHAGDPETVGRVSPNPINLAYLWRIVQPGIPATQSWLAAHAGRGLALFFEKLAERAASAVDRALPLGQMAAPTPIHGDLRLDNCVVNPAGPILLDWERFGLGDPAQEVATFLLMDGLALGSVGADFWLQSYLDQAGAQLDQPNLAQRIAAYGPILRFRQLAFLLDGLRSLTPNDVEPDDRADTAHFLGRTVAAVAQASAEALEIDLPDTARIAESITDVATEQLNRVER